MSRFQVDSLTIVELELSYGRVLKATALHIAFSGRDYQQPPAYGSRHAMLAIFWRTFYRLRDLLRIDIVEIQ